MNIQGKRIILRAIESGDLPVLHNWFNDPDIAGALGGIHFPSSLSQQEKWFERIQSEDDTIRLAVQNSEAQLVGYSGFWQIDWRDRRAEHALVVAKEFQGRKYGRDIIMACARYAFEEMGLHRLEASVLVTNEASLKLYRSCGFQDEGSLRQHSLRGGCWVDRKVLGLLKEEYGELITRTHYWESEGSIE
jgi:RimJ/RimL family protein N-acetyltransferase